MAEQDKPFVINDRRKFRMDGEPRETAPEHREADGQPATTFSAAETEGKPADGGKVISIAEAAERHDHAHTERPRATEHATEPIPFHSHSVTPEPEPVDDAVRAADPAGAGEEALPPPPTPEEIEQVKRAYDSTAERLDTVMRATNPGGEHLPPMDFTRLVQSIYMSAMVQMGAGTPQGEQARVDLMGAKQSIDMLQVIADKANTLGSREQLLIDSALFELRMGFLEITQMLARQAAARQSGPGGAPGTGGTAPGFGATGGPRIVT